MKVLLVIITLLLSACVQGAGIVGKLDRLDHQPNKWPVFQEIVNASVENKAAALSWLQRRIREEGDPWHQYVYAIMLEKDGQKELAASTLLTAMITIRTDAAICKDRTAPLQKIEKWESHDSVRSILQYFKTLSKDGKELLIDQAFAAESRSFSVRVVNRWICSGGMNAIRQAMENVDNMKEVDNSADVGRAYHIDTSKIEPELLPVLDWASKRQDARYAFIKTMRELR